MIWIGGGSFVMGEESGEDATTVLLTDGFWMSRHPVTATQWGMIMGKFLSRAKGAQPIAEVSWHDAIDFCNALTHKFGNLIPDGYKFSLPTEAQWEYCYRLGNKGLVNNESVRAVIDRMGWYSGNSGGKVQVVESKNPDGLGMYDMMGNVWEWCYDGPAERPVGMVVNLVGDVQGNIKNFRGGSWATDVDDGEDFVASTRVYGPADIKKPWIGFRTCLRKT